MSVDSSFSMPLNIDNYNFIKDDLSDIKEVRIVDLPFDYNNQKEVGEENYAQTELF